MTTTIGSFRGVSFFVSSGNSSGSRRVNIVNYPEIDNPAFEDMGRGERTFSFTAYVMGDSFEDEREKLIAACEASGAGKLIHPYRGEFQARCTRWTVDNTSEEDRIARFSLEFLEDKQVTLLKSKNTRANLLKKKRSLMDKILAWFESAGEVARKPINYIDAATAYADKGLDLVQAVKGVTSAAPEFVQSLRQSRGRLDAYALNVRSIGQDFVQLINFGTDVLYDTTPIDENNAEQHRKEMIRMARDAQNLGPSPGNAGLAIQQLIQLSAISGEIGSMSYAPFKSAEEAILAEQQLVLRIDTLLDTMTPTDELYTALMDAREALHSDLTERVADLPRLVEIGLKDQTDLLSFSMDVYGSLEEVVNIAQQNGVIHPGFVTPAYKLLVRTL